MRILFSSKRHCRRRSPQQEDRMDTRAARRSSRLRCDRWSATDRKSCSLRRKLRARQSPFEQRFVRRTQNVGAGACDCGANTFDRDWHGLFSRDPPGAVVSRVQPLCQLVAIEKQMPRLLQIAMQTSLSRGGVSVLVVQGDVASTKMTSIVLEYRVFAVNLVWSPSNETFAVVDLACRNSNYCYSNGGSGPLASTSG